MYISSGSKKVCEKSLKLPIKLTWIAIAKDVEIETYLRISENEPVIILRKEDTPLLGFGFNFGGIKIRKLSDGDTWISKEGRIGPLWPSQIISASHSELVEVGILNRNISEKITQGPRQGGLDCQWGHAIAYYDLSFDLPEREFKVRRWWTDCNGPGYSCSYEHPNGLKLLESFQDYHD